MVQIPELNSKIFYFPQGHAEHAYQPVHFATDFKIPSKIPCRVEAIHYRADPATDEVYAKLRLVPLHSSEVSMDDDDVADIDTMSETKNKYQSYTKILTQSDANNGGGFSCPKYCAETLFPPLDYSDMLPSQEISPKDVHGETWRFRHAYRGAPKRHLFTTRWSDFVTAKLLVLGDSLVFVRDEYNDLHVGIRRSKKRNDNIFNFSSKRKLDSETGICLGPSSLGELRISDKVMGIGKVKAEDVLEAVRLAVNMQPFEVVYYPGVGTPEFFVKTSLIRTALQIRWHRGMRFKMAIETEDSSKINWYMGTIASIQAADPAWPDSLWRLLQVTWDEPDLVTNTKMLNLWQVEIVSEMPSPPFLPSSKKLRLAQHPTFSIDGQLSMPTFPNAGMQGARHNHFSHSNSSYRVEKIPLGLFWLYFRQSFDQDASTSRTVPNSPTLQKDSSSENVSGENVSGSMSISTQPLEKLNHEKPKEIVLFGQKVYTKPKQLVLFGQKIHINSGYENGEEKITKYSSDSDLQDSSSERLEYNLENQCKNDTLEGETMEIEDSGKNK
ncbi:auxin response factor 8-like [Vicia villosa]|uniref:auxin response factor 8-like n=1 Tax=Vicia villosa TaxID=3911 RepID=UPI00273CEE51|nr:auxin response factor 8-like [Vicia villosa]